MRDEKRICEATIVRADGVVLVKLSNFMTSTTPALRATPPLLRRGHFSYSPFIHTFYDRGYTDAAGYGTPDVIPMI